jgi:DNA-binding Xre family transcriptional regulator
MQELTFRCNLKEMLESRQLSQAYVGRNAKVSLTTLRNMTSGVVAERIDRGSTAKILKCLDCKFEDLWSVQWEGKK